METKQTNLTDEDLIKLFEQYKVTPNRVTTNEEGQFVFYKETIWHNLHFESLAHTVIGSAIGIIVSYCMGLSFWKACLCTATMVPASYARQYLVARFFGVMRRRCK